MAVRSEQAGQETSPSIPSGVTCLRSELGERLTAVIAGVTDASIIRAWAAGRASPEPATERTLRAA